MENGAQPQKSEGQRQSSSTILTSTEICSIDATMASFCTAMHSGQFVSQGGACVCHLQPAHCYTDSATMHWLMSNVAQQWKRVHTCTIGD
eukprot:1229584-Amphidinium_carterae.1